MGGTLLMLTMDHTKIQTIQGHPFLTLIQIISSFKVPGIENDVRVFSNNPLRKPTNRAVKLSNTQWKK